MKLLLSLLIASGCFGQVQPQIRGTSTIFTATGSSAIVTVSFPSGTAVGDVALLFGANFSGLSNATGWTILYNSATSGLSGGVFSKVMTSTDVAAGNFAWNTGVLTPGVYGIVMIQGPTTHGVRETDSTQSGSVGCPCTVPTSANVSGSDLAILFGSNRCNNTNTISVGTSLGTAAGSVSGIIGYDNTLTGGAINNVVYGPACGANFQTIVVMLGAVIRHQVTTN